MAKEHTTKAHSRASEDKKEAVVEKAREEEKTTAKAQAKNKMKVKEEAKNKAKSNATSSEDQIQKDFEKKLDEAIKKRLASLPKCKGGNGDGNGNGDGDGILGGTNVFEGKINATDAVGYVGFTNYSVNKPPYKVKRCDQILLLPGKKLDPKDYCRKEDAFMTMSIYMSNFFLKKDPNKLVESFPMDQINSIPQALPGAPGCTMWTTKTRSFPFCYESQEILDQVIEAYYAFMNCRRGPQGPAIAAMLLKACDPTKLNLSKDGPFGPKGPLYLDMMRQMNPDFGRKQKVNLADINPYYVYEDRVHVPGSFLNNIQTRMNPYGRNPYNPNTPNMFSPMR